MKSGAGDGQHAGGEMVNYLDQTKKLKFGIFGLQKLVGLKVVWDVIGQ